jgi:hypothetical protein
LTERETDTKETETGKVGSFKMRKRISSTTYEVAAYFNEASGETLDDKILRLVRGEALNREDERK